MDIESQLVLLGILTSSLTEIYETLIVISLIIIISNFLMDYKLQLLFNSYSPRNSDQLSKEDCLKLMIKLDSYTPSQHIKKINIPLSQQISYLDFKQILLESSQYYEIIELLDNTGIKSNSGSYIKSGSLLSLNEKDTSDISPEYYSGEEEEEEEDGVPDNIDCIPDGHASETENKDNRKCSRLCAHSCNLF